MSVELLRADGAARELAESEFVRPVALEAGAGTGKTRALVRRLATWLLGPGWEEAERELRESAAAAGGSVGDDEIAARVADGVVAITFTEAAAAEMAKRLGKMLVDVAAGRVARDLDPPPTLLSNVDRCRRAKALAATLSRLRVQTIHAFCHALLAAHPFEAGIHPALEVDADGSALAAAGRDALLGRIRAGEPALLELIARGTDPLSIHEALVELVDSGARAADLATPRFSPELCRALLDELGERAVSALPRIEALAAAAKRSKRVARAAAALAGLVAADAAETVAPPLGRLAKLCARLADDLDEWRALADWRSGELNATETKVLGEDAGRFLAEVAPLADLVLRLAELDPGGFEVARRALGPLVAETRARLERSGSISFDDLLSGAGRLLASNRWVRRRVRREIRQLLVDEFQDTDRRQCALLAELALVDDSDAARPGLFVVGDPKQSIYAWRSADLVAYESLLAAMTAAGGLTGRLAMNFRSAPPILAEVERSVAPAMRPVPGLQPSFEPLLPRADGEPVPGFDRGDRAPVEFWLTSDAETRRRGKPPGFRRAAEIEAAAIAADIASLSRRHDVSWGSFAILLRARGDLEIYLDALRRAGVPYAVQKDRSYYRRREVIDVVSLVRAILDPSDRLALVGALRSPFVGVPDAAWIPLWQNGFPGAVADLSGPDPARFAEVGAIVDRAAAAMPQEIPGLAPLAGWPAALLRAIVSIAQARAEWSALPVALWIERLRARFLVEPIAAARFLGRFGLANLERLLGELERELGEAVDPLAALTAIRRAVESDDEAEEARPPGADANAVFVMTIHAAKGLEFEHVYLPQIHRRPPAGTRLPGNAFISGDRSPTGVAEAVLLGAPSPGFRDGLDAAARARDAEAVRLLYVALTRAKQRLVVCGIWPLEPAPAGDASTFVDLLAARRPETLGTLFAETADKVSDSALWRRIEGIERVDGQAPETEPETGADEALRVTAEMREWARLRQLRPPFAPASAAPGETARQLPDSEAPAGRSRPSRGLALARGVALHRALELEPVHAASFEDWKVAVVSTFRAARGALEREESSVLAAELDRLPGSRLWRRLSALGPNVLSRELPVVLGTGPGIADGPLDGYLGTLDLLYRDSASGEIAIADFKSDPAPEIGGDDPEAWIAEKRARYRTQLALYGRAVQLALDLSAPPRLELWMLAADRIVVVDA